MIAAFLVVLAACNAASTEQCAFEEEVWYAPSPAGLQECADLAERLRSQDVKAICELVPAAEPSREADAKRVKFTF